MTNTWLLAQQLSNWSSKLPIASERQYERRRRPNEQTSLSSALFTSISGCTKMHRALVLGPPSVSTWFSSLFTVAINTFLLTASGFPRWSTRLSLDFQGFLSWLGVSSFAGKNMCREWFAHKRNAFSLNEVQSRGTWCWYGVNSPDG